MSKRSAFFLSLLLSAVLLGGAAWAQPSGLKSTTLLQASSTPGGQPIVFPLFRNQFVASLVEIAPGGQVGRHLHPVPIFLYILDGELTVEADGQQPRIYRAGEAAVEVTNTWHNAFNRGRGPARFLVVAAGEEGTPVTIRP